MGHSANFVLHGVAFCPKADVNIFFERFNPSSIKYAKINCFIPNPEWFHYSWQTYLTMMNYVFVKTNHAIDIFKKIHKNVSYIGFTSLDHYRENIQKVDDLFFHQAGKSWQKQTDMVIRTWSQNPSLPKLIILQDPSRRTKLSIPSNIEYICEHITDEELVNIMNKCSIHVCPSETEGFGHYINEALGCKSIIITTDAEPMNEFVNDSNGILCKFFRQSPKCLATNYYVCEKDLLESIHKSLGLSYEKKNNIRENARKKYLLTDNLFRVNFKDAIERLV